MASKAEEQTAAKWQRAERQPASMGALLRRRRVQIALQDDFAAGILQAALVAERDRKPDPFLDDVLVAVRRFDQEGGWQPVIRKPDPPAGF